MARRTRRAFLGVTGSVVAGLAGCTGSPAGTPTPSPTRPPTETSTGTPGQTVLRLAPTTPPAGATLAVYPTTLRGWLREAASTGTTLRVHAETPVVMPEPPLPSFDRVRLADPADEVDGWYAVRGEGGIRYRYLAGAEATTPPDGAAVTPVADLGGDRRTLAVAAIEGDTGEDARFYPETELGEWARTEFFGGYFRRNGTVYRGMEVQQTDAAFFSHECWYVLSLEPVDGGEGPVLALAAVDGEVRSVVDGLLGTRDPDEPVARDAADLPGSVIRFFEETDYLLTHSAVLASTVERNRA